MRSSASLMLVSVFACALGCGEQPPRPAASVVPVPAVPKANAGARDGASASGDVLARPASEIRCFAWSREQATGACVIGYEGNDDGDVKQEYKLALVPLRRGMARKPSMELETKGTLLTATARKTVTEALRGYAPWSPSGSEKDGGQALGGLKVFGWSNVYEEGGPEIWKLTAKFNDDTRLDLGGTTPPPVSFDLRLFQGETPTWIVVEDRGRTVAGVLSVSVSVCDVEKATCDALD